MPIILGCTIALFAIEHRMTGTFFGATSSEAAGRIVLSDKTRLLVSHLLCCLHNIPLEYVIPHSVALHVARVSTQRVLRLQMV